MTSFIGTIYGSAATSLAYSPTQQSTAPANTRFVTSGSVETEDQDGVLQFLRSDVATQFVGQWVALDQEGGVLASAESPGDLQATLAGSNAAIVFVPPPGVRITA